MNVEELKNSAAYIKNNPITKPEQIDKEKLKWNKMDDAWIAAIKSNGQFWYTGFKFNPNAFNSQQLPYIITMLELRDHILQFGGEQVCMPFINEYAKDILSKGQFWYGDISEMIEGERSRCHSNIAKLWNKDDKTFRIATGYALSADGMYREHTWGIKIGSDKNTIIETTEPRVGYFGFVLNDEESEAFIEDCL